MMKIEARCEECTQTIILEEDDLELVDDSIYEDKKVKPIEINFGVSFTCPVCQTTNTLYDGGDKEPTDDEITAIVDKELGKKAKPIPKKKEEKDPVIEQYEPSWIDRLLAWAFGAFVFVIFIVPFTIIVKIADGLAWVADKVRF